MSSCGGVDEVSVMLHVEVHKSIVVEIPVPPPAVSEDGCSREHPLSDDGCKCEQPGNKERAGDKEQAGDGGMRNLEKCSC